MTHKKKNRKYTERNESGTKKEASEYAAAH